MPLFGGGTTSAARRPPAVSTCFRLRRGVRKEELNNNNNKEEKTMLMPLTVDTCKNIVKTRGGGGICWRDYGCVSEGVKVGGEVGSGGVCRHIRIGLVRRLGGGRGGCGRMPLFTPPETRGRRALSPAEAEGKMRKLVQIARKCDEERIHYMRRILTPLLSMRAQDRSPRKNTVRYVPSLCLRSIRFSCAQLSCEIREKNETFFC